MHDRRLFAALSLTALSLAASPPAFGLANRVFVSQRSGNNANSCDNITTPCQTFAGAIAQLNPGGEAIVLDSGGYGPVTISQSVTIDAPPGVLAFIHPPSGTAITVHGSAATVVLRGLTLDGGSASGIAWDGNGILQIENCVISGFAGAGIVANPTGTSKLSVKDTIVRSNGWVGVYLQSVSSGPPAYLEASIDRCRIEDNAAAGVDLESPSLLAIVKAVVRDSVLASNQYGLFLDSNGLADAFADSCSASGNTTGMQAQGISTLHVMGSSISHNGSGLVQSDIAFVETIGNNMVRGNGTEKSGTINVRSGD